MTHVASIFGHTHCSDFTVRLNVVGGFAGLFHSYEFHGSPFITNSQFVADKDKRQLYYLFTLSAFKLSFSPVNNQGAVQIDVANHSALPGSS